MPIINAFPEGGGSGGSFDNDTFVVYETLTQEQPYSTSSSATVTRYGYINATSKSNLTVYATHSSSNIIGNQTVYLYAVKDTTVNLYKQTTVSSSNLLDTVMFTKGHKYKIRKYQPSSTASRFAKITDETTSEDIFSLSSYPTATLYLEFS